MFDWANSPIEDVVPIHAHNAGLSSESYSCLKLFIPLPSSLANPLPFLSHPSLHSPTLVVCALLPSLPTSCSINSSVFQTLSSLFPLPLYLSITLSLSFTFHSLDPSDLLPRASHSLHFLLESPHTPVSSISLPLPFISLLRSPLFDSTSLSSLPPSLLSFTLIFFWFGKRGCQVFNLSLYPFSVSSLKV